MDKNIWTDIKTIFFKAIELDGKEREKYLDTVCKTPEEKKEILTLIFAHDKSENFLEDSIISYEPIADNSNPVSYTHLRAHETVLDLVCRLLLEKKNKPH